MPEVSTAEQVLAYVLCGVMIVLAIETLFSFMLDIYRPRTPDTEPRACFDSRLLALIAEPGGIASTIAEAINYQFGFEVSQDVVLPVVAADLCPAPGSGSGDPVAIDMCGDSAAGPTCDHRRWGRQLNAKQPLSPGFYWKWPWPMDTAQQYETGRPAPDHCRF